jgi:hypothetical protein
MPVSGHAPHGMGRGVGGERSQCQRHGDGEVGAQAVGVVVYSRDKTGREIGIGRYQC